MQTHVQNLSDPAEVVSCSLHARDHERSLSPRRSPERYADTRSKERIIFYCLMIILTFKRTSSIQVIAITFVTLWFVPFTSHDNHDKIS